MGSSSSAPPEVPGLSFEERELLSQQKLSLEAFSNILQRETINQEQNQGILRQLSGLYDVEDVAAVPGEIEFGKRGGDLAALGSYGGRTLEQAMRWRSKAGGFNRRGTNTATELIQQHGFDPRMSAAQAVNLLNTNQEVAMRTGFAAQAAETPASKKYTLRDEAVEDLRKRVAAAQAQQEELTGLEQGIYKTGLLDLQSQLGSMKELSDLELERRKKALEGKFPVSEGLLNRKADEFQLLRESAARRGINIEGDTPETATSQSTAGNELVGQFKKTYGLLEEAERRGEIAGSSTPSAFNAPQYYSGQAPAYGTSLGFGMASTAGGLLPQYGQMAQLYGGAAAPFQQQRFNQYQGLLNQYSQGRANRSGTLQAIGTGAGIGGQIGGGYGAAIGGLLGLGAGSFL